MANPSTLLELVHGFGEFPAQGCTTLVNPLVDTYFTASTGPNPTSVLQAQIPTGGLAVVPAIRGPLPLQNMDGRPFRLVVSGKVQAQGQSVPATIKLWQGQVSTTEYVSSSIYSSGSVANPWVGSDSGYTGTTIYGGSFNLKFDLQWDGISNSLQGICAGGFVGKVLVAPVAITAWPAIDTAAGVALAVSFAFGSTGANNKAYLTEFALEQH